MKDQYDVAIIGAGIAGLTAGAVLAKAGLKVALFEKEPQVGGYLAAFSRNGYHFDSSIKWLNECAPGGVVHRVFSFLGGHMPFCPPKRRIKRYLAGEKQYLLTDDPFDMLDRLARDYPDAARGLRVFGRRVRQLAGKMQETQRLFRSPETMGLWERLWYALRMGWWFLPISDLVRMSGEKGLRKYFGDSRILELFPSEQTFMAVITPFAWALQGNYQNAPQGGAGLLAGWLQGEISRLGGEVYTGQRVTGIRVASKRGLGLGLENGAEVRAAYILSTGDLHSLFSHMLPPDGYTRRMVERFEAADVYDSEVNVFVGLDCPAADLGMGEELVSIFTPGIERDDHNTGDPDIGAITMTSPSASDPGLAPPGRGTLNLSVACPYALWRDLERNGEEYRRLKERYARVLLSRVERVLLPGLSEHVAYVNVATPVTYQRYTGNRFGSIMGTRPTPKNIRAKLSFHRTPYRNLFLCGHWTEYGGGIPMAVKSAANASLLVLQDLGLPAARDLSGIMDATVVR